MVSGGLERPLSEHGCPGCGGTRTQVFYEVSGVPTNSVLLLDDQPSASAVRRGDITLAVCADCGLVHNASFDPALTEYSSRYESTQAYSATFNAFNQRFAEELVERFDLRGKDVIEIGCGHGEFLALLCEIGGNRGLGFDPAYREGALASAPEVDIRVVADFYSERYADRNADFVTCKMTLEHIIESGHFVEIVHRALRERPDTIVCFQVPNARYVFGELAFWDVYYEHCSYFTEGSLTGLFRRTGFDVIDTWTDYDDQYLMIAARPVNSADDEGALAAAGDDEFDELLSEIDRFATDVPQRIDWWRRQLGHARTTGQRVALWGGGSKGVAFLTTVGIGSEVEVVIDVNPRKAGTFMAGTGHRIALPEELLEVRPDQVIVMNPIYVPEITAQLTSLGLSPSVVAIDSYPAG